MSGRPEVLFPLFGALTKLDGVGPKTAQTLTDAGVRNPRDVLMTLPLSGVGPPQRGHRWGNCWRALSAKDPWSPISRACHG